MEIQFLGQGYEKVSTNSVGNHLIELLSDKDYHSFTAISAFISRAGVIGLTRYNYGKVEHLHKEIWIFQLGVIQTQQDQCFLKRDKVKTWLSLVSKKEN